MYKKEAMVSLVIALAGLALISASTVGYVKAEEGEVPKALLVIVARGIAVHIDTERILPARQILVCAVFEPIADNVTLIPLLVVKGVVRIGPLNYNITSGRGAIVVQRHVLMLFCNGTTPEGEDITYRLFGIFSRTPEGLRLIRAVGMLKIGDSLQFVLFFLGRPKMIPPILTHA